MRKFAVAALAALLAVPAAPALAHGKGKKAHRHEARYESRYAPAQEWRGDDGRYYCRRPNGTTGLVVGGALGALLGREVDGGRDRTLGTVVGAAGGALLGRELQRGRACR